MSKERVVLETGLLRHGIKVNGLWHICNAGCRFPEFLFETFADKKAFLERGDIANAIHSNRIYVVEGGLNRESLLVNSRDTINKNKTNAEEKIKKTTQKALVGAVEIQTEEVSGATASDDDRALEAIAKQKPEQTPTVLTDGKA